MVIPPPVKWPPRVNKISETICPEAAPHRQVCECTSYPLTHCHNSMFCKLSGEGLEVKRGEYSRYSSCWQNWENTRGTPAAQGHPCYFCFPEKRTEISWKGESCDRFC